MQLEVSTSIDKSTRVDCVTKFKSVAPTRPANQVCCYLASPELIQSFCPSPHHITYLEFADQILDSTQHWR